ncbi:MAG: lipid A biosynthesis acyltransferase [Methylococcaceae bacterium]|nr:lipid A biosynthesis acyltransferase [Methylococcaceae bacterium]
MNSAWQAHKEYSTPLAINTIRWIALNLGRPAARLLLYPITLYYVLFAAKQRRGSQLYLTRIFKRPPSWWQVAKHIHCFSATILDRIYLITGQFAQLDITFPAENMPLHYSKNGIGCLLLGSHLGSFEVLRSYAIKKCPLPVKILMHEGQTPMIMHMLNALNPNIAETIIPHTEGANSLLKVKEAIASGFAVGLLGDRTAGNEHEKTAKCMLLGAEVEIPTAPILIAATLQVPLIVFFGLYRGGNHYEIHFELLSEKITLNRNSRQQDIQYWTQQYASLLEKYCLKQPYNWFNFYDYWQEDDRE